MIGLHLSWLWLLALVLLAGRTVDAQSSVLEAITSLPNCGVRCVATTAVAAGCDIEDVHCLCTNRDVQRWSYACLFSNCTMDEGIEVANAKKNMCHLPSPSKSETIIIYTAALFGVAFIVVGLRLVSKSYVAKARGVDDTFMATAILLAAIPLGCQVSISTRGYGKHLWDLHLGDLQFILQLFYIAEVVYIVVLSLLKVSLVMFYWKIFKQFRGFRIAAKITVAFVILSNATILFLTIFSCRPVEYFWNKDIIGGSCMNIQAIAYANGAIAIAQDVVILVLPLTMLPRLHMKLRKKVTVAIFFVLGSFGTVASMIRLNSLLQFGETIDPSWDYTGVSLWTTLELFVGFLCASLPAMRQLLFKLWPKKLKWLLGTNSNSSYKTPPIGLDESKGSAESDAKFAVQHHISKDIEAIINETERSTTVTPSSGKAFIVPPSKRSSVRNSGMSEPLYDISDFWPAPPPSGDIRSRMPGIAHPRSLDIQSMSATVEEWPSYPMAEYQHHRLNDAEKNIAKTVTKPRSAWTRQGGNVPAPKTREQHPAATHWTGTAPEIRERPSVRTKKWSSPSMMTEDEGPAVARSAGKAPTPRNKGQHFIPVAKGKFSERPDSETIARCNSPVQTVMGPPYLEPPMEERGRSMKPRERYPEHYPVTFIDDEEHFPVTFVDDEEPLDRESLAFRQNPPPVAAGRAKKHFPVTFVDEEDSLIPEPHPMEQKLPPVAPAPTGRRKLSASKGKKKRPGTLELSRKGTRTFWRDSSSESDDREHPSTNYDSDVLPHIEMLSPLPTILTRKSKRHGWYSGASTSASSLRDLRELP